jgi:hypothetical protein
MPFLQEKCFVFDDRHFNAPHLARLDAINASQTHRRKPELAFPVWRPDVDVRRFASFVGAEVEGRLSKRRTVGSAAPVSAFVQGDYPNPRAR